MSDPSQYQPVDVPPPQNPPTQVPYIQAPPAQAGLSDSAACGLAYFTFVPGLVFLLAAPYNQNREIRFHSWQSIIVFFTAIIINVFVGVALGIAGFFLPHFLRNLIYYAIECGWFILWLLCAVNGFNGKRFVIPVIGDFAAKQANG